MNKAMTIRFAGLTDETALAETARALAVRLAGMGRAVELVDKAVLARLETQERAAYVCGLLVRNGVFAISLLPGLTPDGAVLDAELSEHDTPDFAAEKILDDLAEAGVLVLDDAGYSAEDEELVRKRLADLGYIE